MLVLLLYYYTVPRIDTFRLEIKLPSFSVVCKNPPTTLCQPDFFLNLAYSNDCLKNTLVWNAKMAAYILIIMLTVCIVSIYLSLSFSMSLRFDGHFSGGPGLAGIGMSPSWILLQLTMMELVSLHLRYLNAYFNKKLS